MDKQLIEAPVKQWFSSAQGPYTPWGMADNVIHWAEGIAEYSTPTHGGFHLSQDRMKQLYELCPQLKGKFADGWFEEDCDWAIVVVYFPEFFTVKMREYAPRCLNQWNPEFKQVA